VCIDQPNAGVISGLLLNAILFPLYLTQLWREYQACRGFLLSVSTRSF